MQVRYTPLQIKPLPPVALAAEKTAHPLPGLFSGKQAVSKESRVRSVFKAVSLALLSFLFVSLLLVHLASSYSEEDAVIPVHSVHPMDAADGASHDHPASTCLHHQHFMPSQDATSTSDLDNASKADNSPTWLPPNKMTMSKFSAKYVAATQPMQTDEHQDRQRIRSVLRTRLGIFLREAQGAVRYPYHRFVREPLSEAPQLQHGMMSPPSHHTERSLPDMIVLPSGTKILPFAAKHAAGQLSFHADGTEVYNGPATVIDADEHLLSATYTGMVSNNQKEGLGQQIIHDTNTLYVGMFHQNLRDGVGKLYHLDTVAGKHRLFFSGTFQADHAVWGRSNESNGDKYVGGWKLGKYHGRGKLQPAHGPVLEGNFADGILLKDR